MSEHVRYDANGRAIPPQGSLADAAVKFDGDWDADLAALDAPAGSAPVSMRQWLIEPTCGESFLDSISDTPAACTREPGHLGSHRAPRPAVDDSLTSKLEGLQETSISLAGIWHTQEHPHIGQRTTVNVETPLPRFKVRRFLRSCGLPIATHSIISTPCEITTATRRGRGLDLEYRALADSTTRNAPAPADYKRLGHLTACTLVWAAVIHTGTVTLRSLTGG